MSSNELKKNLLKVFIGFLSLTAAIAIICVLTGEFGEFQAKVLITTLTISAASICSMSCAAFIEIRRQRILGGVGIAMACLGASLLIGGIWAEARDQDYWRTVMSVCVVAVAFAHGFLVVLPELRPSYRWIFVATPICIGLLAVQILIAVWEVIEADLFFRVITVNSILVVLLTLIVPILIRIDRGKGEESDTTLRLTRRHRDVFVDEEGALYRVIPASEWPQEEE